MLHHEEFSEIVFDQIDNKCFFGKTVSGVFIELFKLLNSYIVLWTLVIALLKMTIIWLK